MAQTKHEIQAILAQASASPLHRFGQNFMIDQNLVRIVAEAGELGAADLVVEVGPGTGTLTEELLSRAGKVIAVEIDRNLARVLRERYGEDPKFELIEGDALEGKHAINEQLRAALQAAAKRGQVSKLVANLPYNIASPLIVELLIEGVELLAFTVQKEVAMRLRAGAGSDDYGPLSVIVQMLADVELLRTLPPQAFWPAPKIESALVRVRRHDRLGEHARHFGTFVHRLFSARRKTLRNSLLQAELPADAMLRDAKIDGGVRPEQVAPEAMFELFGHAFNR